MVIFTNVTGLLVTRLGDTHLITPYTWLSTSQQSHSAFKMFLLFV